MLLIPNYVGPSAIEGVGVFAAERIAKGTIIWTLDDRFDQVLSPAEIAALGEQQRQFVERYGYSHTLRPDLTVLELDNGRFMNHADDPNTEDVGYDDGLVNGEGITVAARDIQPGEEIFSDYRAFDADARNGEL